MKELGKKSKIAIIVLAVLAGVGAYLYNDFHKFCATTVPVFAYHRVEDKEDIYSMPPKDFEAQMAYLKACGYQTIHLDEYAVARKKGETLHNKVVCIFDDGYLDNLTNAAPIMQKYGFSGSMYMAVMFEGWPGYIDWDGENKLVNDYKWEIGSHTFKHKPLPSLKPAQVKEELDKSKLYVMGIYNPPTGLTLSYPTGATTPSVMKQVAEAGYIAAVCGKVGVNTDTVPMMALNRVNVFKFPKDNLGHFKRGLLKAQLASWGRTYGIDIIELWDKLRGNVTAKK